MITFIIIYFCAMMSPFWLFYMSIRLFPGYPIVWIAAYAGIMWALWSDNPVHHIFIMAIGNESVAMGIAAFFMLWPLGFVLALVLLWIQVAEGEEERRQQEAERARREEAERIRKATMPPPPPWSPLSVYYREMAAGRGAAYRPVTVLLPPSERAGPEAGQDHR